MNATHATETTLEAIDSEQFFAPANEDAVDVLIEQYDRQHARLVRISEFISGPDMQHAASYFFDAQESRFGRYVPKIDSFFDLEPAVKALDASFWDRALRMTDVLDYMPSAKRSDWYEQIRRMDCPAFEPDTVRDNLRNMLNKRLDFLSEMIEGIFRGLSGEHVTNRPEGFSKRMIISGVYNEFGSISSRAGLIHDLRAVVSKLMNRDMPHNGASMQMLDRTRRITGVWHTIDGGAMRIRSYKKGTAHLEVHPDIAWRLNEILAQRHPLAIPAAYRRRPRTQSHRTTLMTCPIPFAVLHAIERGRYSPGSRTDSGVDEYSINYRDRSDKHLAAEIVCVMQALGGVLHDRGTLRFDFPAKDVIDDVLNSGILPDERSHQFYPTPESVAKDVIAAAGIGEGDRCLEPSAGQGGLAGLMPASQTQCVEISALNCQVLQARGLQVVRADFLEWSDGLYDRICQNPPFDRRRALAHIEHAASMLSAKGRLVCVLPASYRHKTICPGFKTRWLGTYENAFPGVSIDVAIVVVER